MALKIITDFQSHYTEFSGTMHGTHYLPFTEQRGPSTKMLGYSA